MDHAVTPDRRRAGEEPAADDAPPRMSVGNAEADYILGGGFPENSINIIMGHPGSGKTIFAEQLIFHNAGGDRPILYLTTLSEPLAKVVRYLQGFRFFDETKLGTQVIYEDVGPRLAKEGAAAIVPLLQEAIRTLSPRIIVIDSFKAVHDLAPSVAERRRIVYEMTTLLTAYGTTAFLLASIPRKTSCATRSSRWLTGSWSSRAAAWATATSATSASTSCAGAATWRGRTPSASPTRGSTSTPGW
jgi:KaiC/GvpD/RAD55 family RecA-like ATPase